MKKTWILIANATRARVFERRATDRALVELADFVYPVKNLVDEAAGGDLPAAPAMRARSLSPILRSKTKPG
jgi:hypothetical protein